jgi:hypothetical protein
MANPKTDTVLQKLVTLDTSAASIVVGGASEVATTGTGGINAGPIVGTTISDSVGLMSAIRAGALGLTSQGAGDIMYATSATQYGRVNGSGVLQLNGAGAPTVLGSSSVGAYRLLLGTSGTSTSAAAANVATVAITGLTILDRLVVSIRHSSIVQQTLEPIIYNVTDSLNIVTNTNGAAALAAATTAGCVTEIGCDPADPTQVTSVTTNIGPQTIGAAGVSTPSVYYTQLCVATTAFTGSWTIGLRHGGVTAGGTYRYSIDVWKKLGQ